MELIKAKGKSIRSEIRAELDSEGQRAENKDEETLHPMPNALYAEHGGNIYQIAEEMGLSANTLIDFSASINPLGVSKRVKDVINRELNALINYPDPDAKTLRMKLAEYHGIAPETIICGNGSTELIYLIPRSLKPETALIPAPTFSEYERACKTSNKLKVTSYKLKKENNFRTVPEEFISAIKENVNSKFKIQNSNQNPSLVTCHLSLVTGRHMAFLCNPNNPTGHLLKKGDVLGIAEAARDMQCVLVVDEAFIDFRPEESVIDHVQDNPYLIVLRSMTKFYALTGLRIGYGVFHPDLISRIIYFKEPWTVNNLAQKAAITALEDNEYARQTFELMAKEKEFMERGFRKMGVRFYPSAANYYLLKIPPSPMVREGEGGVVPMFREKGILVRDCSNFAGLGASYVRVAVKSRKHNKMLLKELNELKDAWRVIPAKAGIQEKGTGFRLEDCRNDGKI
ncbi:MAG: threonine-phosphate decarboxylase [Nitrospiraceae bacterium]|nr:MAG: threonine-phosphate decarboxylase [Nitrospiraceae bacterium]